MARIPREAEDFVALWLKQNDAVEREADQKAFDALPPVLRELVNNSPIQLSCLLLLRGCRALGAPAIEVATRHLLLEWTQTAGSVR